MSIATELALLANTKEQIRLAVGASKTVPFSTYVDLIDGNPASQLTVDPSLIGIERQTAILANTKESLRVALGLSTSIPFSQYASHITPHEESGAVFDFVNNQYSKGQAPVNLSDISEFIRLSSATMWQDGELVEEDVNVPRISSAGLLLEDSATELIPNNSALTSINTEWAATSIPDTQIGNVFEFVSDGSTPVIITDIPVFPNGNVSPSSGYYYRSILAKKSSTVSFLTLGSEAPDVAMIIDLINGVELYVGASVVKSKISYIGEYYLIEFLATESAESTESIANSRLFRIYASNNIDPIIGPIVPTIGHKVTLALPSFRDTADFPQSVVKTSGTQITRAPDTLKVPLLSTQTISGDWDEGVTYETVDNEAVFTGHGYIRNIRVEAL